MLLDFEETVVLLSEKREESIRELRGARLHRNIDCWISIDALANSLAVASPGEICYRGLIVA